jgi:pimeloyl-ACP methyl ester carboxylesterase
VTDSSASPLTVVLVHGAFADSSGWNAVVQHLLDAHLQVVAVSNPLRGLTSDTAYVRSAIDQINGPVLAVGHSYGGAVITNGLVGAKNVVGLVYVSGFAPDEGEVLGEITAGSTDSVLNTALQELRYPTHDGQVAVELAIDPQKFHSAFAADVPEPEAAVMAATQRPVAAAAFTERNEQAAWRSLPTWAVIASGDKAAGSDVLRSMAQRAGARITEVDGSHVIMVSQPQVVVDVILDAIREVSERQPALASHS